MAEGACARPPKDGADAIKHADAAQQGVFLRNHKHIQLSVCNL